MEGLLSFLSEFWENLRSLFGAVELRDYFDIIIVAFIIYEMILLVRHTRAQQLVVGILVLLLAYGVAAAAQMRTLIFLLDNVMNFGIVVLAVIFQPELRRALEQVGGVNSTFARLFKTRPEGGLRTEWEKSIVAVCDACERMAESRVGALIVLERATNLNEIVRTGTRMRCDVNVETLNTIFYLGTPLHDGAVIMREGRIEAAGCFLPLSNNLEIGKDMGTRHRAALGMSENSDAISVVVSEENGVVSLAKNGVMIRRLDRQGLMNLLISEIVPPQTEETERHWFTRHKKEGKKDGKAEEK